MIADSKMSAWKEAEILSVQALKKGRKRKMENKEFEQRMQELKKEEAYLAQSKEEAEEVFERTDKVVREKEELFRKLKKQTKKRAWQIKFMFGLAEVIVIAAAFSAGMVLGRCLAFVNIFGC